MRTVLVMLSFVGVVLLPAPQVGAQQSEGAPGMFGPRLLGHTLRPMPRIQAGFKRGGIAYGRSGQFYGIDAESRTLMFGGLPWQYRPREIPLPRVGRGPLDVVPSAAPEQYEPPPANQSQPQVESQPEIPPAEVPPDEEVPGEEQSP
jgi:hypothetical protein